MKIYKKVCTCGKSWLSDDKTDLECVTELENDDHIVRVSKDFSSEDYAEMWSMDLEDANRHDMVDAPNQILGIIKKVTKSEPQTKEIMKQLFEMEIGV